MITLPALQSWLGQELETRGIDAVIYTRYVLSILQQDSFEPDTAELDPFRPPKEARSTRSRAQQQRKVRRSWTDEDWKKYAVLQCLQAVTDKDCGIESLVEELCLKLKRVKKERDRGTKDGVGTSDEDSSSPVKPGTKSKEQENSASQAAKYYQAFPALSDKTNTMMTSEPKPHGAWGTSKKSSSPDGQRDMGKRDRRVVKSVSAATSRGSRSPARKHQRTKSLPNSVGNREDSLAFVVPKFQAKGYAKKVDAKSASSRHEERTARVAESVSAATKPSPAANCPQPLPHWALREKSGGVLNVSPNQSPEFEEFVEDAFVDEREISWYTEPVIPVLAQGKTQSKLKTVYQSGSNSPCVKTPSSDISLEEAVNSLAESLCRDMFEDEQLNKGLILSGTGLVTSQEVSGITNSPNISQLVTSVQSLLEGDSAEIGRHGDKPDLLSLLDSNKPDLYTSQGRNASALQAMPLLLVDSQASLGMLQDQPGKDLDAECIAHQMPTLSASSSQEHLEGHAADLMGVAYPLACIWDQNLPPQQEPWEKSPIKINPSGWVNQQGCSVDQSSEQEIHDSLKSGQVQDLPEALQVLVDHDKVTRPSLSSHQEEESLLRICCPSHSHHQCSSTSGLVSQFLPGHFPFSEEGFCQEAPLLSPNSGLSCSDPGSPFYSESEPDSLAKGIKLAYHLDESTPTAVDPQPFDINSALWSTYDAQPHFPQPPKIVRWEDGSFFRDGMLRRCKSSFIEGGVYGSPYSSQNNSHYNSCSTSPCETSSLRDLWNPAAVQEVSALVTSMQELISPDSGSVGWKADSRLSDASSKRGTRTPEQILESSQQDEQSLIEDSLMDSPVYICSRSSSRFEFARSVSDLDGSLSPASAVGTETDDMVSEAELLEEALKDIGEQEEFKECNKNGTVGKLETKDEEWSDSLKHSLPTDGSSQELTPSWLTPPRQEDATGFMEDLCSEKSQGSLSLTGIVPSISKPEAVRQGKRHFDLAVGGTSPMRQKLDQGDGSLAMDELLISPKTHFRPIHETISPDDSSGDEAADRSKVLDSPRPERMGETNISKVVGSAPRKSPPCDKWGSSQPASHEPESVSFPAGSPTSGIGSNCRRDDGSFSQGQTPDAVHRQSGHQVKYENLPWISGQHGEAQAWTGQVGGKSEVQWEAESDLMLHPDYENQMFAFEDEAFLQGEGPSGTADGTFKPLYASELEEMWLGEAATDAGQDRPPWRKHRRKAAIRKKPCSFFLEGKCRRAECPFAHDVSRITCRFWEEGQCLKAQECPFMHRYPSEEHSSEARASPGLVYGHADTTRRTRNHDNEDTGQADGQANSPNHTPEGAIPFSRRARLSTKPVLLSAEASPNHARSLPIRIRQKPR